MNIPNKQRWIMLLIDDQEMELTALRGLHFLDSEETLVMNSKTSELDNMDGVMPITNTFDPFEIKLRVYFDGNSKHDYYLVTNELRQLLAIRKPYYVIHSDLPMFRYPVNKIDIDTERLNNSSDAIFTLTFTVYKGYKESISDTLDDFSTAGNWGFGMGFDVDIPPYTNSTKAFQIFNAGFDIDPRMYHQLKVAFSGKVEKELIFKNESTTDIFKYTGKLSKKNTLLLDGVYPYLDSVRCGRSTNNGILRLKHGLNNITVEGATDFKISFAFHYLYR